MKNSVDLSNWDRRSQYFPYCRFDQKLEIFLAEVPDGPANRKWNRLAIG